MRKIILGSLIFLFIVKVHGANLILNPGFEQIDPAGKPVGWSFYVAEGAEVTVDKKTFPPLASGKQVTVRMSSLRGSGWSGLTQSGIKVQGDTEYLFNIKHVESEEFNAMMCVLVAETDAKGNKVGEAYYLSTDVPYSFIWTTWSKSFKTQPKTALISLTLYPRGNGTTWIDQISLVKFQGSAEEKKWRSQPCDQATFSENEYWQREGMAVTPVPGGATLTVSSPDKEYGYVKGYISYDLGHPFLQIKVNAVDEGARWVLVSLSEGMDRISPTQTQAGLFTYDLKAIRRISGKGKIVLGIYVLGKGKSITLAEVRTVSKEVAEEKRWEPELEKSLAVDTDKGVYPLKGEDKDRGYVLAAKKPFETITYSTLPTDSEAGKKMSLFAAPGEYEPATFIVYAGKELTDVAVAAGELKNKNNIVIPMTNIDIRVMKVWYQGGNEANVTGPIFVPELLLKDDGLITSDHRKKSNVLHFESLPSDGPLLKPVHIPANSSKQFWLTVKVPDNATPGSYSSTLTVQPANAPPHRIELEMNVLPIQLREPEKMFGMYYSCNLTPKNETVFWKEITDMRAHGLNSGCNYNCHFEISRGTDGQWVIDLSAFKREMDLWIKAGFTKPFVVGFFMYCADFPGSVWSDKPSPADKSKLITMIRQIEQCRKANRYPKILYYGVDEPAYDQTGKTLEICRTLFNVMHEAGGKTTTAITKAGGNKLGNAIDAPIYDEYSANDLFYKLPGQKPSKLELHYWHPLENPAYDRFRFGLLVWKAKLDGAYPYAYRAEYSGVPYVDFETLGSLRNQVYTYPSKEGPVPTIQWEGVREGIDDVRYLTTLDYWVKKAGAVTGNSRLNAEVEKSRILLDHLPPAFNGDLALVYRKVKPDDFQTYRHRIADQIITLQELLK